MLAVGTIINVRDGLPARVPPDVATAAAGALDVDVTFRRRCSNFDPEAGLERHPVQNRRNRHEPNIYSMGRFARVCDGVGRLRRRSRFAERVGLFAGSGGCAPLLGVSRTARRAFPCEAFNDRVVDLIRSDDVAWQR